MSEGTTIARRILLTGAAGHIGSAFREYAGKRYWLRLADRDVRKLDTAKAQGHEIMMFDIADPEACQKACQNIDTVVHLAADASPEAAFYGSLLENNIKGTYNIFRGAKDQGCRRVIFASSAQAVSGYPYDTQVHPNMAVRPKNMYGVSKCFGEAVAAYFAYGEGLSSVAIRIGAFDAVPPAGQRLSARDLSAYVSPRDLCHLLVQCIETADLPPFTLAHGISDNRFKLLNITETRESLDYRPRDDAFQVFDIGLHG